MRSGPPSQAYAGSAGAHRLRDRRRQVDLGPALDVQLRAAAGPATPASTSCARPSRCMTAGTSSSRTTVASMRIAEAMPTPMTLRTTSGLGMKAANTATMIAAAAVMTRPVPARPSSDRAAVVAGAQPGLAHPADQEDLVVHRQPEQHREHQHRDERRQRRLGVDADQLAGPAALQDERDDAVRRGDGQQVHHGRLDRDRDAAERDEQQQHRQQHHAADEQRDPLGDVGGAVDRRRGDAADVHLAPVPPTARRGSSTSRSGATRSSVRRRLRSGRSARR